MGLTEVRKACYSKSKDTTEKTKMISSHQNRDKAKAEPALDFIDLFERQPTSLNIAPRYKNNQSKALFCSKQYSLGYTCLTVPDLNYYAVLAQAHVFLVEASRFGWCLLETTGDQQSA